MAALDWHSTTAGEVTLVELLVTSDSRERVRIENRLDGPVWPPRRQGIPAEGWSAEGYAGVVRSDDPLVLGYASPAAPSEPPAQIVEIEAVSGDDDTVTPRELVRTLGDPTPPRCALPPATGAVSEGDQTEMKIRESASTHTRQDPEQENEFPQPIAEYLASVDDRLAAAERLAAASSVEEASDALTAVGGADGVADLSAQLRSDRTILDRLVARSESLGERIDAVEVPVETLTRIG